MDWFDTFGAALAETGLTPSDIAVSLVVAFLVFGAAQTRQFSAAVLVLLSLLSAEIRRQRQKLIARRILSMVRSGDILRLEILNIQTNMVVAMVMLAILLGMQIFEVKIGFRDVHGFHFSNSSDFLLNILAEFGKFFKIAVALAGVYVLFEIFEDSAVVRTALNVRYKGPSYLKEHKALFDPFAGGLIPRSAVFLFVFVTMLFFLMIR